MLTPVALLQPVDVGGVTVSRVTLHNQDEVRKKDVRPGDEVRIERAGDVTPEVVERIETPGKKRAEPFSMPDTCPVCGSEIVREGVYYLCPAGMSCEAQLVSRIIHYAARDAAKEKVEMLGARATSSVSGETDFLVVGERPGSKLKEARKYNVEILAEKAFKDLIGE